MHLVPQVWRSTRLATLVRRLGTDEGARVAVFAAICLIVLARSAVFVFFDQSHIDSNQAVIGLMAKHLAELRAFPLFMYGQNYQLAVEAWLAAPLFLVAGVSVTALKLPLLAINIVVAILLVRSLNRETGLPLMAAGLAAVFFVLPGPGTASTLLEASGGTLEPLLYIPVLWLTRHRPAWCGLILGIGVLHREFTIYAFLGLLTIDAVRGSLFTRHDARRILSVLRVAAEVWLVVQVVKPLGAAMGPGTTPGDLPRRAHGLVPIADRLCFDWQAVPAGFLDIVTVHWPRLFATAVAPLHTFNIESATSQGMPGAGLLLGAAMLTAALRILIHLTRERRWRQEYDFCAYLVVVGSLSAAGFVLSRCGVIIPEKMRYDMLSILGAVGLAGWYLRIEHWKRLKMAWVVLVLSWTAVAAAAHGRLWAEYLGHPPIGGKQLIVRHLEARGIRYAIAEYRYSYVVTFLTNEAIVAASSTRVRVLNYQVEVGAHREEAVVISQAACDGGRQVMDGIYFCPPRPPP